MISRSDQRVRVCGRWPEFEAQKQTGERQFRNGCQVLRWFRIGFRFDSKQGASPDVGRDAFGGVALGAFDGPGGFDCAANFRRAKVVSELMELKARPRKHYEHQDAAQACYRLDGNGNSLGPGVENTRHP
jgi:hypothetical protein